MCNNILSQSFDGGLLAGLTTSQISGDNLGGFNKLGIAIGIFTQRDISEKYKLKFELSYFQKGSKNNNLNLNLNSFKLDYIEAPFYFSYLVQQNTFIQFGFHTGFLLLQKETDNFGSNVELRDNFNAIDFSTSLGIEYYVNNQISLNTKFSNTLFFTPIRKHASNASLWYNQGQYNTVISFTINYYLINSQ
jgi:hypothetical protein